MRDLSFASYETHDPALLTAVEAAFAGYAAGVMSALGKAETLKAATAGAKDSVFFPHGTVDKAAFTAAAEAALRADTVARPYPAPPALKQAEPPLLARPVTVVESSQPLTLTGAGRAGTSGSFQVPQDTHLVVFGDVVCIEGLISAPGMHIAIVARELRTRAVGTQLAELNVSAAALGESGIPAFTEPAGTGDTGGNAEAGRQWEYEIDLFSRAQVWQRHVGGEDKPAQMGQRGHTGSTGGIGKTGLSGGDIQIFCHRLADYCPLRLVTQGGPGGRGQTGQTGGKGGKGGDGLGMQNLRDPATPFVSGLAHPPVEGASGNSGGDGGYGGPGGIGGAGGNITVIVAMAPGSDSALTCVSSGGEAGPMGYGGAGGVPGDPGANFPLVGGTLAYADISGVHYYPQTKPPVLPEPLSGDARLDALKAAGKPAPAELATPPGLIGRALVLQNMSGVEPSSPGSLQSRLKGAVASVGYLHRLLESVRLLYLQWDGFRLANDAKAPAVKAEMMRRLDFVSLGLRLLPDFLPAYDKALHSAVSVSLTALANSLALDRDYFGNPPGTVPLGSPDIYVEPFKTALKQLSTREKAYADWLALADKQQAATDQIDETIGAANDAIGKLAAGNTVLREQLVDLVSKKLPAAQTTAEKAKQALLLELRELGKWVREAFGLGPEDFINCVFNLAFIGDLSPSKAGQALNPHGAFSAFTTLTSQSATLIAKAIKTLPDDEGQPVSRQRLLLKVESIGKRIQDLGDAWHMVQNRSDPDAPETVSLADPDNYRLLVVQKDFDDMIDRFSTFPISAKVKEAMAGYVAAIQARNEHLAAYNTLVAEYLRAAGEVRTTQAQIAAAEALRTSTARPDLQAHGAFLLSQYNRTRDRCLYYCYLASRSFHFWTLTPDTTLYERLKLGTPSAIDQALLSGVIEDLYDKRTEKIVSGLSDSVQSFPPKATDYTGTGKRILLKSADHPKAFEALRSTGKARFELALPAAADSIATNPFVTLYDVRVTKVRVWVLGVSSDNGMCNVRLSQLGEEVIRDGSGAAFSFRHKPVNVRFQYKASKVRWNAAGSYAENPAEVLKVDGVDGDLGFSDAQGNLGSCYQPLVGPFAQWEIELSDQLHVGLKRAGISAICLEFHGFSRG